MKLGTKWARGVGVGLGVFGRWVLLGVGACPLLAEGLVGAAGWSTLVS